MPKQCEVAGPGCTGQGRRREDPYQAEIHDRHVMIVVCDHCHQELLNDI
jgi:hypothetical protein